MAEILTKTKLTAETEIGDFIGTMGAASCLAHGAKYERDGFRLRVPADYAANGPNVGVEMLFERRGRLWQRIKWEALDA